MWRQDDGAVEGDSDEDDDNSGSVSLGDDSDTDVAAATARAIGAERAISIRTGRLAAVVAFWRHVPVLVNAMCCAVYFMITLAKKGDMLPACNILSQHNKHTAIVAGLVR